VLGRVEGAGEEFSSGGDEGVAEVGAVLFVLPVCKVLESGEEVSGWVCLNVEDEYEHVLGLVIVRQ